MGGKAHEDYGLFQAAKYLGVEPWTLAEQPTYWRDTGQLFAQAEALAAKDQARRSGKGRGKGYGR